MFSEEKRWAGKLYHYSQVISVYFESEKFAKLSNNASTLEDEATDPSSGKLRHEFSTDVVAV